MSSFLGKSKDRKIIQDVITKNDLLSMFKRMGICRG